MNWPLLQNSLLVSGGATLLAMTFGWTAALALGALPGRGRNCLLAAAVIAFALPPFLVTNTWLHYLGATGVWRGWLPLNVFSAGGVVWVLALLLWPITALLVWGAWQKLEAAHFEADPALRGWPLVRWLLLPAAGPALGLSALVTFVLALNNFAVPAILQVRVFPAEIWVEFSTTLDPAAALRGSWPLVAAPAAILLWLRRREVPWPRIQGAVPARVFRNQVGPAWLWTGGTLTGLLCLLSVGLPLLQIFSAPRTWTELPSALAAGRGAVWNSGWLAAVAATLTVGLGLLAGASTMGRRGARGAGGLMWFPFFVPGVLLGIALIAVFNRPPFLAFYRSAGIVVVALVIRYLAIGWHGAARALETADRDLSDAARLEGATGWQVWRHVLWPQVAPPVAVAGYAVYLLCLWDAESLVLLIPPGGETLALRIFNLLHYGHNAQVNALCLILLGLAVAPLAAWGMARTVKRILAQARARAGRVGRAGAVVAGASLVLMGCSPPSTDTEAPVQSRWFSKVQVIGSRGVAPGQFNKPRSVAVDGTDNLYVVDMTGRVQKFAPDGRYLLSWQMPQTDLGKPKGMARDAAGNILVVEPHYQRVNHFSPEGRLVGQWGENGTNAGQLKMPRAVAVNTRGEIFVSEYGVVERVQKFSGDGRRLLGVIGRAGTGPGEFNRPEGLGMDAQDRLYVADSCNHRIQVFDRDGRFLRAFGTAGTGAGELSYPYDVCVDAAGRVYVCEFGNSRIQVFDADGQSLEILGGPGTEPGRFANPWGVALDSKGNLYVADSQNHRVQKFLRQIPAGELMRFHFTDPWLLLLLPPAAAWVIWFAVKSDVQAGRWRRGMALAIRLVILLALGLALAGLQWLKPIEGMNVFYLLDRSDSIPPAQQELAREYVVQSAAQKKTGDKAGVIVFGAEASLETLPHAAVELKKIQTVVGTERTDLAAAVRLGTAAFPETGQKRLVLLSDGNENLGDAVAALLSAKSLGATVDVLPLGVARGHDVAVKKLAVPPRLKKGQTFEAKIFVQADAAGPATVRLLRNDQSLTQQTVELQPGKNLFTFPQTLTEPGFYTYEVQVDAPGDPVPQNNHASAFTSVQGNPRLLLVSAEPEADRDLAGALEAARLGVKVVGPADFPGNLAALQSYDAVFLCNIEAGAIGPEGLALLESAVRDFGVGLVCVGGDRAYAAGGYRNTPLETTLPVSMELDSKKVLPPGAVVLVMHGMEFNNGNQVARDCALGVLKALGPQDEMGVVLWDGKERWQFPLQKVGDKQDAGRQIAGMNQGDLGSFQGVMSLAHDALKNSRASLKHIIVFSDGDPAPPADELLRAIVGDKITVSTVLISGHAGPDTMIHLADLGRGRFYNVTSPADLPQIFIKETAVILKSAIYEEPFQPQVRASSELLRGFAAPDYPPLLGYVATSAKPRAETPLWTPQGDPLLAHWQYGLGRAVAFTSDAKAKWARDWLAWAKYRQFWSQAAQWSLRRLENADFTTELTVDKGEGQVSVEALDAQGDYRNFLNLQAAVISPKGQRQTVRLEQTGPGHYEARFPTKEVGVYMLNVMELKEGRLRGSQVVGASVNYSPEFNEAEPNLNLLRRLAELSGGKRLDPRNPAENPFLHDRLRTYQPRDLWEWLLKLAILLFPLDVGVRRLQIDREEWQRATATLRRWRLFWRGVPRPAAAEESLAALLARRNQVRQETPAGAPVNRPELFRPQQTVALSIPETPASPVEASRPPASSPGSTASRLLAARRKQRPPPEDPG